MIRNLFEIIQALGEWFIDLFKRDKELVEEPHNPQYTEREKEVARIINEKIHQAKSQQKLPDTDPVVLRYDSGWRAALGSYIEVKLVVPWTKALIPVATFTNFHMTAEQEAEEIIKGMASLRK